MSMLVRMRACMSARDARAQWCLEEHITDIHGLAKRAEVHILFSVAFCTQDP
jgi:hypothetical protein